MLKSAGVLTVQFVTRVFVPNQLYIFRTEVKLTSVKVAEKITESFSLPIKLTNISEDGVPDFRVVANPCTPLI
jgi:hypothetical protein